MPDPTVHAETRIRTLLAQCGPEVKNLGSEIVYSDDFRSEEWPRGFYALTRVDVEAVFAKLDQARRLRLARPSEAVDPAVHTPERIRAYLTARGWALEAGQQHYWVSPSDRRPRCVFVPWDVTYTDYAKCVGLLAYDLADVYDTGELQILTDIAASTTTEKDPE